MTVTADSYEAKAVEFGIHMLASSATFMALLGVATAALAKDKIVESWGGSPGRSGGKGQAVATTGTSFVLTPPYAVVHQSSMDTELGGVQSFDHSGTIAIQIHLSRLTSDDTPPDTFRRGRNTMGAIRAEIEALFGSSNCLATGTVRSEGPSLPSEAGAIGDELTADLFIDWFA